MRSFSVPSERMLRRKVQFDVELAVAFGKEKVDSSDECKKEARLIKEAIWSANNGIRGGEEKKTKIEPVGTRAQAWCGPESAACRKQQLEIETNEHNVIRVAALKFEFQSHDVKSQPINRIRASTTIPPDRTQFFPENARSWKCGHFAISYSNSFLVTIFSILLNDMSRHIHVLMRQHPLLNCGSLIITQERPL